MSESCGCYACVGNLPAREGSWLTVGLTHMIVCDTCGNKRCPHGTDHRNDCTGSNEPGQPGSRYGQLVGTGAEHNLRALRHELETPFRGHDADGECCRRAAGETARNRGRRFLDSLPDGEA